LLGVRRLDVSGQLLGGESEQECERGDDAPPRKSAIR
jgi:hypothetical protein